jgi:hypothetical protein
VKKTTLYFQQFAESKTYDVLPQNKHQQNEFNLHHQLKHIQVAEGDSCALAWASALFNYCIYVMTGSGT